MMLREVFSEEEWMAGRSGQGKIWGAWVLILDQLVVRCYLGDMEKTCEAGEWMEGGSSMSSHGNLQAIVESLDFILIEQEATGGF